MLIWYGHFVCLDLNLVNFQKKIGRSITNVTRVTKSLLHGLHRRELLVLWHQEYTQMLCGRTYLYRKMPYRMIERVTISWWNNNVTVCYMWMDMDTNNWMNEETPIYTHIHFVCTHYYKNVDLSRLGNPCCPESGNRDKRGHFVPVGNTYRDKRCCQRPRGWRTLLSRLVLPTGTKCPFFYVFLFSILFLFQLYFCISIKLMYWNSVCMISTNIYIYI